MVTPRVVLGFAEKLYERVAVDREFTLELIVPHEMFDELVGALPAFAEKLLGDPDVQLYQATIPFSFGLWLVDEDQVGLFVFTDHGVSGLLVNDTDAALAWANEQYERVKEDARPIFRRGARVRVYN